MKMLSISWLMDQVKHNETYYLPLQKEILVGQGIDCDVQVKFWRWEDLELTIRNDQTGHDHFELISKSVSRIQRDGKTQVFGAGKTATLKLGSESIELEVNQKKLWIQISESRNQSLGENERNELDRKVNEIHNLVSTQRIDDDEDENAALRNREIVNEFKQRVQTLDSPTSVSPNEQKSFSRDELTWLVRSQLKRVFFADLFGSSLTFEKPTDLLDKLVLELQAKYVRRWLAEQKISGGFELNVSLVNHANLSLRYKVRGADSRQAEATKLKLKFGFDPQFVHLKVEDTKNGSRNLRRSIQHYITYCYSQLESALDKVLADLNEPDTIQIASKELLDSIDDLHHFGPLRKFFDKKLSHVTDISVDQRGEIYISVQGSFFPIHEKIHPYSLQKTVDGIKKTSVGKLDRTTPILNSEVGGLRANLVHSEIGSSHQITLRKKFLMHFSLEQLEKFNGFPGSVRKFLHAVMQAKKNVVISGGLGSGKTSLLIGMLDALDRSRKVATIEDTREIELHRRQHFTPHLTRAGIDEQELLKSILRSAADLIALGEIRSPQAADAMVKALNTGQAGITTIHSNSARDTVTRLVNLLSMAVNGDQRAASESIHSALDFIVHMERNDQGLRQVREVCEVVGVDKKTGKLLLKPIFEFFEGRLVPTGMLPRCILELHEHGYDFESFPEF